MLGYGQVRPLSETFRILKLVPPSKPEEKEKVLSEGSRRGSEEKERLERRRIIEQARRERSGAVKEEPKAKKGDVDLIIEEIESLEREIRGEGKSDASSDLKEHMECLSCVEEFSGEVVKRYGWRSGEKEKLIAELFSAIRDAARNQKECISSGKVGEKDREGDVAKEVIKKFVEALDFIKDQFCLNETFYRELKKWAEAAK